MEASFILLLLIFVNVLGGGEGDPNGHPGQLHEHAAVFLSDALQLLHQKVMVLVRTFNSDAIKGSEDGVCVEGGSQTLNSVASGNAPPVKEVLALALLTLNHN